ncbi:MAG TPA: PilZ domain-containing protein [Smithella sp.]|nr:PilZ domain-containing protein [Smithella sp.]HOG91242.1 PilZ domain-containing protein [Smithella sp.]
MNISVSGARIKTDVLLPVETLLKVDFSLEDMQRKIGTIGQVKWMKVVIEDESYNEGVKFDNPSRKLADYIAWKQKSRSPI